MKRKKIISYALIVAGLLLLGNLCYSYVAAEKSNFGKEEISSPNVVDKVVPNFDKNDGNQNETKTTIDNNVVGTWEAEEDPNWRMRFTSAGKFIEYYVGHQNDSSNYVISNTSPQCGQTVPVDQYTAYISLTKLSDSTKKHCYLLNGTTDSTLSISPLENNRYWIFKRIQ